MPYPTEYLKFLDSFAFVNINVVQVCSRLHNIQALAHCFDLNIASQIFSVGCIDGFDAHAELALSCVLPVVVGMVLGAGAMVYGLVTQKSVAKRAMALFLLFLWFVALLLSREHQQYAIDRRFLCAGAPILSSAKTYSR